MAKTPRIKRFSERSQGIRGVQNALRDLRDIHSFRGVMRYFDLSFRVMGMEIAYYENRKDKEGRDAPYSKGAVHRWATRPDHKLHKRPNGSQLSALAGYVTERLREIPGIERVFVSVSLNSPLTFKFWTRNEKGKRIKLDLRK